MRWPLVLTLLVPVASWGTSPVYPPVLPGRHLEMPQDFGAHAAYRTEWWYVTGWLAQDDGKPLGFQVTFFRSRPDLDQGDPSRFAPTQLLFADAALSDPTVGRLLHGQRAARAGFGLAGASSGDTDVHVGEWILRRDPAGSYSTRIDAGDFRLDLRLNPTGPLMIQGDDGYSRKGPVPGQASEYYSEPQLQVVGTVTRRGRAQAVSGRAWLDHEWSSTLLAPGAVGWDWIGINLDDGGALMAFRIRDAAGRTLWSDARWRLPDGSSRRIAAGDIGFRPLRRWRSPRTGADYPVSTAVTLDGVTVDLVPLMDDQESDSRSTTGAVYWEGAVTALRDGKPAGRGYLELTGYLAPLKM